MFRKLSVVLASIVVVGLAGMAAPAQAVANLDTLGVYIDKPFVQGSYVTGAGTLNDNFNVTAGTGNCANGQPAGITISGTCKIANDYTWGGATVDANVSTPTTGGSSTNYASTVNGTSAITIDLTNDNKYLGLWWSAGDTGNTVKFYENSTLLLTLTTADIINVLGANPGTGASWTGKNNDNAGNVLTSTNGALYRKAWYFGHPRGYASTTPSANSSVDNSEPFVYLHMFASGNFKFNKVTLSGAGFEFDNLALSTQSMTPDPSLVLVETLYGNHTVTFDSNATGTTGTTANQTASAAANLTANGFTRPGYTFTGWNTAANGSGTAYANQANYDFAADVTLYAQWTANSTASPSHGSNNLPDTGLNVAPVLVFGFLAAGIGLALVLAMARRKRS